MLGGCATTTSHVPASLAAYQTRDFLAVISLTDPPADDQARLLRAMALYNTDRPGEARPLLDILVRHPDPEISGLAHATLGLVEWGDGNAEQAQHHLEVATRELRGLEQTRARRFLAAIAEPGVATTPSARYTVQIGAFSTNTRAQRSARSATDKGWPGPIAVAVDTSSGRTLYAVRVGAFATRAQAQELADRLGGFVRDARD